MAENIEGHSAEVGRHTGTNSIENDKETTELLSSVCSKGRTMGCKTQNKKVKRLPSMFKKMEHFEIKLVEKINFNNLN